VPPLTWDNQHAAFSGGMYCRLAAYVGEIRNGQDIHDAPGLIGGVAFHCATDEATDGATRTVASDDISRAHDLGGSGQRTVHTLDARRQRKGRRLTERR